MDAKELALNMGIDETVAAEILESRPESNDPVRQYAAEHGVTLAAAAAALSK